MNRLLPCQHTVVEGFEMVTKSSFIQKLLPDHIHYHPNHDLTDTHLGRQESWVLGYAIYDLLSQGHNHPYANHRVAIDRHIASSIVYADLYQHCGMHTDVVEFYRDSEYYTKKMNHIYLCHKDKDTAREIYKASKSREETSNEVSNQYDQYSNFDEYWKWYCKFDKAFRKVYDMLGITPLFVYADSGEWYTDSKDVKGLRLKLCV